MTPDDNEGPAPPGSPLRNALDLLIARGCKVVYVPGTKSDMGLYMCYYFIDPSEPKVCYCFFYPDSRGADQAMGLLIELNTGVLQPGYRAVIGNIA